MERAPLPICYLRPGLTCAVVGVVIASEKAHLTEVKYLTTPATKRYVFNFTLRDEREDTINVSVWGSVDYVVPISELCYIGAYVEVCNPRVRDLLLDNKNVGIFFPMVSSQYKLDLDENAHATVRRYQREDEVGISLTRKLEQVFHVPLISDCVKVTVSEVVSDDSFVSANDLVTLVAVVVAISPVTKYNSNDGKHRQRQEIKLMDNSIEDKYVSLVLWDSILQTFAAEWIPRTTVLHLTSVKVREDRYSSRRYLTNSSRTVITMDPHTDEGAVLANFSRCLPDPGTLSAFLHRSDEPEHFNRNRARKAVSVANFHFLADKIDVGSRQQFLVEAFVHHFCLDVERIIQTKCADCGLRTGRFSESVGVAMCDNVLCREKNAASFLFFDFPISIFDSTGMVTQLRLSGDYAEKILRVKPEQFLAMDCQSRKKIEDIFRLEHCEVGIQVEHRSSGKKTMAVLLLKPLYLNDDHAYALF